MKYRIIALASTVAFLALAPAGWSQMVPETNPALAPTKNPTNPTSSESLAAQAQDLTGKINQAKAQGKDTSVASAEQVEGEKSMQDGHEQDALKHFEAGERALNNNESAAVPQN
jgi:hypothetical protein